MATTIFLIRHAAHGLLDHVLCGRMPDVHLGEPGRRQAMVLADRLAREGLSAIYSSPLPRARETAAPIAARLGLSPRLCDALTEIDFGEWAGRSFISLQGDPHWQRWNAERAAARPPGGETMQEVQQRVLAALGRMADTHTDAAVAAVSHGDVIKAAIMAVLDLSIDAYARFEISPAGLSKLVLWPGGGKLLCMNEVAAA